MGISVWDLLYGGVSRYTYPQWVEMLSPGLWSGYASVGFEYCTSFDLQREEFYPSINMMCPGRSCSLGLLGAWEKLPSHSISNVGAWGFLMPGLLVHVGHTVHKLPSNFCRGSRLKSIVYVSGASTQGFCLYWSSLNVQAETVPGERIVVGCVNTAVHDQAETTDWFCRFATSEFSGPVNLSCTKPHGICLKGTKSLLSQALLQHVQHDPLCTRHQLSCPLEKRLSLVSKTLPVWECRCASIQLVFYRLGMQSLPRLNNEHI